MASPRSPAAAAAAPPEPEPESRQPSESPQPPEAKAEDPGSDKAAGDGASPGAHEESDAASDIEDGQVAAPDPRGETAKTTDAPPLPDEPVPAGPRLPDEPVPEPDDDGWECQWSAHANAWYFYNRFTGVSQWENPRVPEAAAAGSAAEATQAPASEKPAAGGYNPAVHGDYDPNAWYAQAYNQEQEEHEAATAAAMDPSAMYGATVAFNRFTGQHQTADMGPGRHSDEAKARRQMNAFFDVDAAANAHDGRSLKAERQNQRISKTELKAYKEKRRAKKEEKRRAWLMD